MERKLYPLNEVKDFIAQGKILSLAGDEKALAQLPRGNWIAGTIPYFMDKTGGTFNQEKIFVVEVEGISKDFTIGTYTAESVLNVVKDSFENGYTILILPAFQKIHEVFALQGPSLEGLFNNPLIGWVSGMDLKSSSLPKTFNGLTGESFTDQGVALHVKLPPNKIARLDIVNIFEQNTASDEIQFQADAFDCSDCLINGVKQNFSEYILSHQLDTKLPLVANYSGAMINVSIREVNAEKKTVSFYAPVFKGHPYKFAKPVGNYVSAFKNQIPRLDRSVHFSCNCILNYLYGELEHTTIEGFTGPATFGEIGYQLLNQTLTYLVVES